MAAATVILCKIIACKNTFDKLHVYRVNIKADYGIGLPGIPAETIFFKI